VRIVKVAAYEIRVTEEKPEPPARPILASGLVTSFPLFSLPIYDGDNTDVKSLTGPYEVWFFSGLRSE